MAASLRRRPAGGRSQVCSRWQCSGWRYPPASAARATTAWRCRARRTVSSCSAVHEQTLSRLRDTADAICRGLHGNEALQEVERLADHFDALLEQICGVALLLFELFD